MARGDEPADLVVRGGKVLSVFTREWLETDVAVVDGWIAGLGSYEGRETIDATGRWVVPGFIDAHMHLETSKLLVDEFARLVLPFGTTAVVADPHEIANVLGTDGVHWLLDATRGAAARRLLHGVVVRARVAVRVAAPRADTRRSRCAAPPPARDRARRDDELPRRDQRCAVGAREARARRARRRPRARRPRPVAERVRGGRHPLRSRGLHGGRGPRAPARRAVAADPRGLGRAQPAGAAAAARRVRAVAHRLLHRRPRARAHRRRRPHQLDGARRGRVRDHRRGRARLRHAQSGALARPGAPRRGRPRLPRRPARAARPRTLRPRDGAEGGQARRRDPARRRCPTGCGTRCGSARSGRRCSGSRGRAAGRA